MQKKIKDLIDHIFENKDIIDESITKYIKGD
jgi:transcription termination factor NusB